MRFARIREEGRQVRIELVCRLTTLQSIAHLARLLTAEITCAHSRPGGPAWRPSDLRSGLDCPRSRGPASGQILAIVQVPAQPLGPMEVPLATQFLSFQQIVPEILDCSPFFGLVMVISIVQHGRMPIASVPVKL